MRDLLPITDDATFKRASARVSELMNNWANEEERKELVALVSAVAAYSETRFAFNQIVLDGVDEVITRLDHTFLTLDRVLPIFGSPERFVEYMTRQTDLDAEMLERLVTECGMDRVRLERPFSERSGWPDLSTEGQDPCDNPECCEQGRKDWRVVLSELLGINRDGQDVEDRGDLILPYPAHR